MKYADSDLLTWAAVKEHSGSVAASSNETVSGILNARSASSIAYSAKPPGLATLLPQVATSELQVSSIRRPMNLNYYSTSLK